MRWPRFKLSHAMIELVTVAIFLSMWITSYKDAQLSKRQLKVVYHKSILSTLNAEQPLSPEWRAKRALMIAHHERMLAKWEHAVRNPWVEVETDPPDP